MKYLPTPDDHLPVGFPLALPDETKRYEPIWARAFEIHNESHNFDVYGQDGQHYKYILTVRMHDAPYCDCYEIAYQQLKHIL